MYANLLGLGGSLRRVAGEIVALAGRPALDRHRAWLDDPPSGIDTIVVTVLVLLFGLVSGVVAVTVPVLVSVPAAGADPDRHPDHAAGARGQARSRPGEDSVVDGDGPAVAPVAAITVSPGGSGSVTVMF